MLSAINKPLGIALLGINKWERSRLELFIDHHWSNNCQLVGEECADLCILDIDSLEGKKLLKQQQDCHPRRPLIALSIHNAELNDVLLLRKPLNSDQLKSTIDHHITSMLGQPPINEVHPAIYRPESKNSSEIRSTITSNPVNHRRSSLPSAAIQARMIRGSCGPSCSIEPDNRRIKNRLYYDPSGHLQEILKGAIEQCRREIRPLRVNLPDRKYIELYPETNIAITNLNDTKLRSRCLVPVDSHRTHISHIRDPDRHQAHIDTALSQDIDGLLWKVTLWSARGRLPIGTDADNNIALREWPNLTRLLATPQFLRIAALWVKTPLSLGKTAEQLNIEARYVRAFFSACNVLELTQSLSVIEDKTVSQSDQKRSSTPKGLLRRILRHLRLT
jgi:hypothetical protein